MQCLHTPLIFKLFYWITVVCLFSFLQPVSAGQQAFTSQSLAKIENIFRNQPFLMILWSIECSPCRGELELVGNLKKDNPNLNVVLISTDSIDMQKDLDAILTEYSLEEQSNWAFSASNTQRLKYIIDQDWYGEMPRSYFYDSAHRRTGISGKLSKEIIIDWMNRVR